MQYFGFDRPSFALRTLGFGDNFDPLELFKGGKQGVWYDPSDKSTLFQDVAGTVPVTKDGDPIGLMKDKSGNGYHATQTVSTARPTYRTDGTLHWLDFDGVDDDLVASFTSQSASKISQCVGIQVDAGALSSFLTGFTPATIYTYVRRPDRGYYDGAGRGVTMPTTGNKVVACWLLDGGTSTGRQYENGVLLASDVYNSTATFTKMYIGSGGTSAKSNPKIYGLIMTLDILPSTSLLITQNYLAKKSGVTL